MCRSRDLEQTPGLIDADVADDVGSMHAGIGVATDADRIETGRQVVDRGAVEHGRIIETDGAGHAVAELGGVLDVVYAGDGVMTADQVRRVVARIAIPWRRIGRGGLTEGEPGELNERIFNRDIAAADGVEQLTVIGHVGGEAVRVERAAAEGAELEVALQERANDAIFRRGTRIDGQRHTRTGSKGIAIAITNAQIAAPRRLIVDAAVERGVDTHITTQLDAGVGARNVEETGTIQGANLHVLDRFGLDGKISCLSPTTGGESRR